MKTREEIKALSFEERVKIENAVLELIKNNDLEGVKNFLKDYPAQMSCYEVCFKDEKGEDPRRFFEEEKLGGDYPLLEPFYLILEAAYSCGEHNNDFSILDYLFNEYGLSLKDPKYNFSHRNMKYIKEINEKYILLEEIEEVYISSEALIYDYIEEADNPNPEIVKYLVDKGARFDIYEGEFKDHPGTPLRLWAVFNEYRLLEVAIKGGANVDMPILTGKEYAREYAETLLFAAVKEPANYRTTQLLIELGANVNYAEPETPLDNAKGTRNKKLLKEAGAMTSAQIEKKFKIPPYYFKEGDDIWKELQKQAKLLNDAIKGAKENPKNTQSSNKKDKK